MIREKKDFSENKNGGVQMWRKKKKKMALTLSL